MKSSVVSILDLLFLAARNLWACSFDQAGLPVPRTPHVGARVEIFREGGVEISKTLNVTSSYEQHQTKIWGNWKYIRTSSHWFLEWKLDFVGTSISLFVDFLAYSRYRDTVHVGVSTLQKASWIYKNTIIIQRAEKSTCETTIPKASFNSNILQSCDIANARTRSTEEHTR